MYAAVPDANALHSLTSLLTATHDAHCVEKVHHAPTPCSLFLLARVANRYLVAQSACSDGTLSLRLLRCSKHSLLFLSVQALTPVCLRVFPQTTLDHVGILCKDSPHRSQLAPLSSYGSSSQRIDSHYSFAWHPTGKA